MFTIENIKMSVGVLLLTVMTLGVLGAKEGVPAPEADAVKPELVKEDPGVKETPSAESLPVGVVVKRVVTLHNKKQSYALYLPKSYSSKKKWPILYAFSPMANGGTPVRLFHKAAERFGWIVVGSNNSRNGSFEVADAAMQAMWKDTHARLAIDEKRIYSTGFSGGARVAFRFAYDHKNFAGVIPCGASFPPGKKGAVLPPKDSALLVCGIGGNKGFNYPELLRMKGALRAMNVRHRLLVFSGAHHWPPPTYAALAMRYMELSARLGDGRDQEEETLLLLEEEREAAEKLLKAPSTAYDGFLLLSDWLPLLKASASLDVFQDRVNALKDSNNILAERTSDEALEILHKNLREIKDQAAQLKATIKELNAFKVAHKGTRAGELVKVHLKALPRRMLGGGYQLMVRGDFERAMGYLKGAEMLSATVKDVEYLRQVKYLMALGFAQTGKIPEACAALGKAVELGYTDVEKLKKHKLLTPIKEEMAFKEIIAKMESSASKGSSDREADPK